MKKVVLAMAILITSCSIDGPICSNATFSLTAWQNESGMLRISYESELKGYELSTGCEPMPNYLPDTWKVLDTNDTKGWAEWSIQRECTPEYIRVRSLDGQIEKVLKL